MTDPVTASLEPRTATGKALSQRLALHFEHMDETILAIEEQAATEARRELLAKVEGLPEDDWLRVAGIEYIAASAVMGIFEDYETRRLIEEAPRG